MPLGTIDRTPPPFFRQGASALTKLIVCAGLALLLMVADARYAMVDPMRAAVATLLLPFQRALLTPVDAWEAMTDYTQGLESAVAQERASRARLAAQAIEAARAQVLEQENRRLRALLDLQPTLSVKSQAAEVLYEAADPFSRKAFINRGQTHGVLAGSPVINERGVLGQITRVYPLTSEVTLLVDRDATLPVLNARNQVRSAAFGGAAHPGMELRFMATNADVQVGDLLTTSGIDGVYPRGCRWPRWCLSSARWSQALLASWRLPCPRLKACAMCWCSSRFRCRCPLGQRPRQRLPPWGAAPRGRADDHAPWPRPAAVASATVVHRHVVGARIRLPIAAHRPPPRVARSAGGGVGVLECASTTPREPGGGFCVWAAQ